MLLLAYLEDLWTNGFGPFQRDQNVYVYPIILVALAIPLIILGRELIRDAHSLARGRLAGRWARVGRFVGGDLVFFALQYLLVYLMWLGFATPYSRLPMDPPGPGTSWLFLPAPQTYAALAYLSHGVLAILPLQLLLGVWVTYVRPDLLESPRWSNGVALIPVLLAVYGWETLGLPVAFTVPVELLMAIYFATIVMNLADTWAGARARSHVRDLLVALLVVGCGIAIWVYHGLGRPQDLLAAFARGDETVFAGIIVFAAVVCVAVAFVGFLLPPGHLRIRSSQAALLGSIGALAAQAVAIAGLWIAYLTPFDRLWFDPPGANASVFAIPLAGVYTVAAVVSHAVLALAAASNLLSYWGSVILRVPRRTLRTRLLVATGYALAVAGWEVQGWPLWLIALTELGLVALFSGLLADTVRYVFAPLPVRLVSPQRLVHIEESVKALTFLLGVGYITLYHNSALYVLELLGVYATLVALDRVVAMGWSIFQAADRKYVVLSSGRWTLTALVVAVLAVVGASGGYDGWITNANLTYSIWLEAGAAATTYMLFKPLVDLALDKANTTEAEQQRPYRVFEGRLDEVGDLLARVGPRPALPSRSEAHEGGLLMDRTPPAVMSQAFSGPVGPRAINRLKFAAGPFFFVLALIYHAYVTNLQLGALTAFDNLAILLGLVGLVAGLLQSINNPVLEAPRWTIMLLMLQTIGVIAVVVVLSADPLTTAPLALQGRDPRALLADRQFLEATVYQGLREVLFLLSIGQTYYLYKAIRYGAEKGDPRRSEEERKELAAYRTKLIQGGDQLVEQGKPMRAFAYYDRALQLGTPDASTWRRRGLVLQQQGKYQDALSDYEEAINLDPENATYWNDKGLALEMLRRYDEALAAYDKALRFEPNHAHALANRGDVLNRLGRFEEGLDVYEHALRLDPRSATYWNDAGVTLHNLRRFEQALKAFDQALAIAPNDPYTLRNEAELLIKGLKQYAEGLKLIDRSIRLDSNWVRAWSLRGVALRALGRDKEADTAFMRALKLDPEPSQTWGNFGDALFGLKRYQEALGAYDRALQDWPHDPDVWQAKAEVLRALGRTAEAREADQHASPVVPAEAPSRRSP